MKQSPFDLIESLLTHAKAMGADAADASFSDRRSQSIGVRMGQMEDVASEEQASVALRAFVGQSPAAATSSDLSPDGLRRLAERVAAMAKAAPPDPFAGLLPEHELARDPPDLELSEANPLSLKELEEIAQACEAAALDREWIANSAGAGAESSFSRVVFATSHGFRGKEETTRFGFSVAPIAERNGQKERDYDYSSAVFRRGLKDPAEIGRKAGDRAAARLGARKLESRKAPVLFENRIAAGFLGPILGAISGSAVARGVSFLKDKLHQKVLPEGLDLIEDPFLPEGLGSQSWDGEGAPARKAKLIDNGILTTWLMNASAARQLGLQTTGHATLGHGGPPGIGTSNVFLPNGAQSQHALLKAAGAALLITETFSPSLNANNGDYSVGAAGFWTKNGEIQFPVSEITVAGNLVELYQRLTPANDLEFRSGFNAPSLLIEEMTIAGA